MKKISYLFALCLLVSVSATNAAPAPVIDPLVSVSGEPEPHPNTITLKFRLHGQQTVYWPWLVFPDTTIESLRATVSYYSDDPDVVMRWNGIVLEDGFTLADYGIGSGAIISCS